MLRDRILLVQYWRDLDFYEQKFPETETSGKKREMSCESHRQENVSLADGNKWQPCKRFLLVKPFYLFLFVLLLLFFSHLKITLDSEQPMSE